MMTKERGALEVVDVFRFRNFGAGIIHGVGI